MAQYDCMTCVNKRSPLCELCTRITSPSGKVRKPKYYVELVEIEPIKNIRLADATQSEIAEELIRMLYRGAPLPTAMVCEYNRRR